MRNQLTFIDLFAGVGGFRKGMELAGHKCLGFCEWDKYAARSYLAMHCMNEEEYAHVKTLNQKQAAKYVDTVVKNRVMKEEWLRGDINEVQAGEIPKSDVWCFGFPCQDISVAGKQQGFEGSRSSLFFRVMELIEGTEESSKPSYLFIENVKNLLSINGGKDFLRLLIKLDELGYDAEWQVLNSKDFGVPQNRERVFIIGHLRGRCTKKIFPVQGSVGKGDIKRLDCGKNSIQYRVYLSDGIYPALCAELNGRYNVGIKQVGNYVVSKTRDNPGRGRIYDVSGISPCLTKMDGGGGEPSVVLPSFCDMSYGSGAREYDLAFCLQSRYYKGVCGRRRRETTGICVPVLTPDRVNKRQNGRRFKENGEPMFTLTSQDKHGVLTTFGAILRGERNDYGKIMRRDYESHKVKLSRNDMYNLSPRTDGVSNTITTVQKDNLFIKGTDSISPEVSDICAWSEVYGCYVTIRRLTPLECFRLQGWGDKYFERAKSVNSGSQLYKQAGNGVTVNVIQAIAEKMGFEVDE